MKALSIALLAVAVLAGCGGGGDATCSVTYEVSGSNTPQRVTMTIATPGGGTGQGAFQVWPNPHKETYTFKEGEFLYISGQNANSWNAAFTVKIIVDGKVVASEEGFGYSVASVQSKCQ